MAAAGEDERTPGRDGVTPQAAARDETEAERIDRNYIELLQELRVAQTGTQILFAFLLTMAFTERFEDISDFQLGLYVVTLMAATAATAFLIAPVSYHRLVFRQQRKDELVTQGNRMAIAGLAMLAVALVGSVLLVLDVALERRLATILAAASALWFLVFWYALPLRYRRTSSRS
jgi:hypothetical protein